MSLENEIKKNTAAILALTEVLSSPIGATNVATPQASAAQPAVLVPLAQASPSPTFTPPATVAAIPAQAPAAAQPGAVAQPMTHQQAQAELGAIVQALGPADTRVQQTMRQYGSARLNEIPAENLFSLVQACKLLAAA